MTVSNRSGDTAVVIDDRNRGGTRTATFDTVTTDAPQYVQLNDLVPGTIYVQRSTTTRNVDVYTGTGVVTANVLATIGRGLNLNGPPLTVDGNAWEGRDAPGYKPVGTGFDFQDMDLKPSADPDRAALIRSGIWSREGTSVTLTGVPPGTYQTYLYVWGVKETETCDVVVRGKLAQSGYTSQVGRWDRLGPWTTEVTDGALEVKAARGGAAFSGLEVWRVGK